MQYMGVGNKLKAKDTSGLSCNMINVASCLVLEVRCCVDKSIVQEQVEKLMSNFYFCKRCPMWLP
jgi:hypothetical protein